MAPNDDTPSGTEQRDPIKAFRGAFAGGRSSDELREETRLEEAVADPDASALVQLLRAAARGLAVQERSDRWHGKHARADLPDATCIQFAYLSEHGTDICLALYPADTLSQARVFYKDDARVRNTLRLAEHGWEIEPNFHFGFVEKGLTWATAQPDLRDRAMTCRGNWTSSARTSARFSFASRKKTSSRTTLH